MAAQVGQQGDVGGLGNLTVELRNDVISVRRIPRLGGGGGVPDHVVVIILPVRAEIIGHVLAQDRDVSALLATLAALDDVSCGIDEQVVPVFNDVLPLHVAGFTDAQTGYGLQEGHPDYSAVSCPRALPDVLVFGRDKQRAHVSGQQMLHHSVPFGSGERASAPRPLPPPGDLEVKTHTTERVPVEESTPLRRARRAAESLGYTVTPTSVHDDEWSLQIIAHRR